MIDVQRKPTSEKLYKEYREHRHQACYVPIEHEVFPFLVVTELVINITS